VTQHKLPENYLGKDMMATWRVMAARNWHHSHHSLKYSCDQAGVGIGSGLAEVYVMLGNLRGAQASCYCCMSQRCKMVVGMVVERCRSCHIESNLMAVVYAKSQCDTRSRLRYDHIAAQTYSDYLVAVAVVRDRHWLAVVNMLWERMLRRHIRLLVDGVGVPEGKRSVLHFEHYSNHQPYACLEELANSLH